MKETNRIEIAMSKKKLAYFFLISVAFLALGLWIIIADPQVSNPLLNNPIAKAIGGYGGAILGLLGILYLPKKLLDKKPAIIIDDLGILDNSNAQSVGIPIPWSDIVRVHEKKVNAVFGANQKFVTIILKNPEAYIAMQPNLLKRKGMMLNYKYYGSPIHISSNMLLIKHEDLLKLITQKLKDFKTE